MAGCGEQYEAKRVSRNECEKRRRDAFNRVVGELYDLVGCKAGKKLDKPHVLQRVIHFLRSFREQDDNSGPTYGSSSSGETEHRDENSMEERLLLNALRGAVVLLNCQTLEMSSLTTPFHLSDRQFLFESSVNFSAKADQLLSEDCVVRLRRILSTAARSFIFSIDVTVKCAHGSFNIPSKLSGFMKRSPEAVVGDEDTDTGTDYFLGIIRPVAFSQWCTDFPCCSANVSSGTEARDQITFVLSPKGQIMSVDNGNEQRIRLSRWEMLGRSIYDLILQPSDLTHFSEQHRIALLTGCSMNGSPLQLTMFSGQVFTVKTKLRYDSSTGHLIASCFVVPTAHCQKSSSAVEESELTVPLNADKSTKVATSNEKLTKCEQEGTKRTGRPSVLIEHEPIQSKYSKTENRFLLRQGCETSTASNASRSSLSEPTLASLRRCLVAESSGAGGKEAVLAQLRGIEDKLQKEIQQELNQQQQLSQLTLFNAGSAGQRLVLPPHSRPLLIGGMGAAGSFYQPPTRQIGPWIAMFGPPSAPSQPAPSLDRPF